MLFNLFTIVAGIGVGLLSVAASLGWSTQAPLTSAATWPRAARTAGAGAVASVIVIGVVAMTTQDFFAITHVVYTIVTIGVPLAAGVLLIGWRGTPKVLRALLVLCVLAAPLGLYATHIEPFWLRVDNVDVPASAELDGLRLGVLADLQTTRIGSYEREAIDTLLAQEPDVVLVPGDFWQMDDEDLEARLPEFAVAMARLDEMAEYVVVVNGNSDRISDLRAITQGTDVIVLDNQLAEFETADGYRLRIAGLSLEGVAAQRAGILDLLVSDAQPDDGIARIVLGHKPDVVFEVGTGTNVDLVVSGHTHGGQIQIPFFGPLVTFSNVPRDIAAGGLSTFNDTLIYVSTGVGRERGLAPQVRFGARPSIGVITFVAADS